MKILECSANGDTRFSEQHVKIKVSGVTDTIYNHYQLCKRYMINSTIFAPKSPDNRLGEAPSYFTVNGIDLPIDYLEQFYKLLWIKYLGNNAELVQYASSFNKLNDEIKNELWEAKLRIINLFVKEGRESAMEDCEGILRLLSADYYMLEIMGDIKKSKQDILVHQVSCAGVMDEGLSLYIKEQYPNVYSDYYYLCKQDNFGRYNMGTCQLSETNIEKPKYIANMFGKELKSDNTEYNYLEKALKSLKEEAQKKGLSVAIPLKKECGAMIGDSEAFYKIIKKVFNNYPVLIYFN